MTALIAWDARQGTVPGPLASAPPGSVVVTNGAGEVLVQICYAPELAALCLEQILKKLGCCECQRPFVREGGPRKRCQACAAEAERQVHRARNRRYRKRHRKDETAA